LGNTGPLFDGYYLKIVMANLGHQLDWIQRHPGHKQGTHLGVSGGEARRLTLNVGGTTMGGPDGIKRKKEKAHHCRIHSFSLSLSLSLSPPLSPARHIPFLAAVM
jgi:hypothetical protein